MLHQEYVEALRRMKPEERLKIGIDLTDAAWVFLSRLPAQEVQRRLDLGREPWNPPPERSEPAQR